MWRLFSNYALIDDARPAARQRRTENAVQHVWGYFKKTASEKEKLRFKTLSAAKEFNETAAKGFLLGCPLKYGEPYLLGLYYFYVD